MKHSILLLSLFAMAFSGCAAKTLDGGNAGSNNGNGTSSTTSIAETPLAGTVDGREFDAKSIYIRYSKSNAQWMLTMDNYVTDCGTLKDRPDPKTAMAITIGDIEPKAGDLPLTYGDEHASTVQIGVYEQGSTEKPITHSVKDGVVRFENWDETPGTEIKGAAKLATDHGVIEGTFTAKMCAPR